MSFLSGLINYSYQRIAAYQEEASDQRARKVVSTFPKNLQDIFNAVAKDQLVSGFSDAASFYGEAQQASVAVLKTKNEKSITFYVGGASDRVIKIIDMEWPIVGDLTSFLKVKDVVCRVLIQNSANWEIAQETLMSDFARCIDIIEGPGALPLEQNFNNSAPLLEEIVTGIHTDFNVISKKDFDQRDYLSIRIRIEGFDPEGGDTLAVCGNCIGMDEWKTAIPLRLIQSYPNNQWFVTIRGNKEMGEFKFALLRPNGKNFQLEPGEPRKLKELLNTNDQELYPRQFEDLEATL